MDLTLVDPMDPALLVLVERALIVEDYQDPTHWGGRMVCSSYTVNKTTSITLSFNHT